MVLVAACPTSPVDAEVKTEPLADSNVTEILRPSTAVNWIPVPSRPVSIAVTPLKADFALIAVTSVVRSTAATPVIVKVLVVTPLMVTVPDPAAAT